MSEIDQVYIRTDLENCVERIKLRNRNGESNIEREYLQSLEKNHESWLMSKDGVLILDGNADFKNDEEIKERYLEQFDNYVRQLLSK